MKVRGEAITAALRVAGGNVGRAVRALGVDVRERIRHHPALWPPGVDHRKRGRPRSADGAALTDALRLAGGNLTRAAAALCVSRQRVQQRLAADPSLWPSELPPRPPHPLSRAHPVSGRQRTG